MINTTIFIDDLDDLSKLDNINKLEELMFRNLSIDKMIFDKIKNIDLETIRFINCHIEDTEDLGELKVKELDLTGSLLDDLLYINNMCNLETLILDEIKNVDLNEISIIKKLKALSIHEVNLKNESKLFYFSHGERLRIDDTLIQDLGVLLSLENLKYLVVSYDQVDSNKDIIIKLLERGVRVVDFRNHLVVVR